MQKQDFLIEIGCEDLPDWSGALLKEQLFDAVGAHLRDKRIHWEQMRFFWTPRRVVLYGESVDQRQKDREIEVSGPPVSVAMDADGRYTLPARRFAESNGGTVEQLSVRERKGRQVVVLVKREKGLAAPDILSSCVPEIISALRIPRAMAWSREGLRFIRPIRWVLALWGDRVMKFSLDGVRSGRYTRGHRVLSPGRIRIRRPSEYFDRLAGESVILDQDARRGFLGTLMNRQLPGGSRVDPSDIERVSLYVEYPAIEIGRIARRHLGLPPEVLCAVLRKLRAIPVGGEGGVPALFGIVCDGTAGPGVRANYEKVAEDRLEDACFFLSQDTRRPLSSYLENLKGIVYHPRWGTVYDRVVRFRALAEFLRDELRLAGAIWENLLRSVELCKNDLATLMVGEFPELQGVIGRIYAEKEGLPPAVGTAIEQQYRPRFSGDPVPDSTEGRLLSLIDRIESLCSFVADGVALSGSEDRFGLKRIANGIVEILWNSPEDIHLGRLLRGGLSALGLRDTGDLEERLRSLLLQRADNILAGEGIPAGVRRCVTAVEPDSILKIRRKIDALKTFLSEGEGERMFVPFTRVANILKQAREKGITFGECSEDRLEEDMEKELFALYRSRGPVLEELYRSGDYLAFLRNLREWKEPVDRFFDAVLVLCPDEDLRENRLALLRLVNSLFLLFADFSAIPPEEFEHAEDQGS